MLCGCDRALVEGSANDQRLWPDGDDGLREHERSLVRLAGCADWSSDLEHADLRIGWMFAACACGGSWGALHLGSRAGAGLSWSCGADGGAVCCGRAWAGGEPDVPQRGCGALARGRGVGVSRAFGCAGEAARLSH